MRRIRLRGYGDLCGLPYPPPCCGNCAARSLPYPERSTSILVWPPAPMTILVNQILRAWCRRSLSGELYGEPSVPLEGQQCLVGGAPEQRFDLGGAELVGRPGDPDRGHTAVQIRDRCRDPGH